MSVGSGSGEIRASDEEREAIVARLNTAVGEGRLTLAEFGDRVTSVYAARTRADLDGLVTDLPTTDPGGAVPRPVPARGSGGTDWHVSPIGGTNRGGHWRIPARTVNVTLIGGVSLDLRDAELSAPTVTITTVSLIGGASVSVPPGIRVEVSGFSLLGGRSIDVEDAGSPTAPVLRLQVFSLLGGAKIRSTSTMQRLRRRLGK